MNGDIPPAVQVFAVEDTKVQLTWRGLRRGDLRFRVAGDDGRSIAAEVSLHAAGGPGAVVLSGLPAGRPFAIEVGGPALGDGGPRVVLPGRTLDPLPGEELTRVGTISDLHLGTRVFGKLGTIGEDPTPDVHHPERCTGAALVEAASWGARRVVAKGDLTNKGQVYQWRRYADLVAASPVPVDAVPGNHDRAFREGQPGLAPEDAAPAFGLEMALPILVRDLPGLRLVLVDSTTDRRDGGRLHHHLDDVLDAVADAAPDTHVLVALHHQLHRQITAEGLPVGIGRRESVDFLDRLDATGRRVLVTSGHTHRHRRWDRGRVTATQVGSTKDYPGVWAGYVVTEGGLRQVVRRVGRPDCLRWTDHTRRAAAGAWRWIAPGPLASRCFNLPDRAA